MNVYCFLCKQEMEIMVDLGTELKVYPCSCGGKVVSEQESLLTKDAKEKYHGRTKCFQFQNYAI